MEKEGSQGDPLMQNPQADPAQPVREGNRLAGRGKEQAILKAAYDTEGFCLLGVYGRRRAGKTALLSQFCREKKNIYLTAREVKLERNMAIFGRLLSQEPGLNALGLDISLKDLRSLFSYLAMAAAKERLVVVIDEFQYLSEAEPGFVKEFIRGVEYELADKNILLIVCGDTFDCMKELLEGEISVEQRAGICLKPLGYREAARLTPGYSNEEKLLVYAVTGGVPGYISLFDTGRSALDNISALFFRAEGYLYEEAKNILRRMYRNVGLYNTLLEVIGKGAVRMNAISKGSGYDTPVISPAVKKLIANGMIEKNLPLLNETSKRDAEYLISDAMLRFYYTFVSDALTEIEAGEGERYFEEKVKPGLTGFLGEAFEDIAGQYILIRSKNGGFEERLVKSGRWRSTDANKQSEKIDVVSVNENKTAAVIGECLYKNSSMETELVDKCIETGEKLGCRIIKYLMFSKSGYYPSSIRKYKNDERVELLTLRDLYSL
jgi:AAA+ ATPase superfamily predicted ATPase